MRWGKGGGGRGNQVVVAPRMGLGTVLSLLHSAGRYEMKGSHIMVWWQGLH